MQWSWIGPTLAAGLAMALIGSSSAQQRQRAPDSNLNAEDQLSPSQMAQPMPGAVASPTASPAQSAKHPATAAAAPTKPSAAAGMHVVACGGPFSKDSSNLKLAMVFDSRNVSFEDVDVGGTKVGASVLFTKDPKRRLEIWWQNPAARSGLYLILINGQSTWSGPGGLKLGLTLADLEKLNHKPFKLKGFDKDRIATVGDWDGGELATLAGDCNAGVSLRADAKASAEKIGAFSADKEYSSSDPAIRGTRPTITEILIGY